MDLEALMPPTHHPRPASFLPQREFARAKKGRGGRADAAGEPDESRREVDCAAATARSGSKRKASKAADLRSNIG